MSETSPDARNVFVVHGRNDAARRALFDFLRAINLNPLEWIAIVHQTGKASPYTGEVLAKGFEMAKAAVVLMTPDDEARLKKEFWRADDSPIEREFAGQPRQNVLFEAGMALGQQPERTVAIELGTLRPMSDTLGRQVVRIDNTIPRRQDLAQRLQAAGCAVNLSGTDWHTTGDFEAAIAADVAPETSPSAEQDSVAIPSEPPEPDKKSLAGTTAADFVNLGEHLWYLSNPPRAVVDNFVTAVRSFLERLDECGLPLTRAAAQPLSKLRLMYDIRTNLVTSPSLNDLATMMTPIRSALDAELKMRK